MSLFPHCGALKLQSTALQQQPAGILKLQSSLTCLILLIRHLLNEVLVPCTQEQVDGSSAKNETKNPNNTQRCLVHRSKECRMSEGGTGSLPLGCMSVSLTALQRHRHSKISWLFISLKKQLKWKELCFQVWHPDTQFTGEET